MRAATPSAIAPGDRFNTAEHCREPIPTDLLYLALRHYNVHHGPLFQAVTDIRRAEDGSAWGAIELPEPLREKGAAYCFHPVLMDAAFQLVPVAFPRDRAADVFGPLIPVGIDRLRLHQPAVGRLHVHLRITRFSLTKVVSDLLVTTPDGDPVADILGFTIQSLETQSSNAPAARFIQETWEPHDLPGAPVHPTDPAAFLPSPEKIGPMVAATVEGFLQESGLAARLERLAPLDRSLAAAFAMNTLLALGLPGKQGARWTAVAFAKAGIAAAGHSLLERLLAFLVADGLLKAESSAWKTTRLLEPMDTAPLVRKWIEEIPGAQVELELLLMAGENLADLLTGVRTCAELAATPGHAPAVARFFSTSMLFRPARLALDELLAAAAPAFPEGRLPHVLIIDNGNGANPPALPDALPSARIVHAVLDESALTAARDTASHAGIECRPLDPKQDPSAQGFSADFDIILAVASLDDSPPEMLETLRGLLRPGGWLVHGGVARPSRLWEMVFAPATAHPLSHVGTRSTPSLPAEVPAMEVFCVAPLAATEKTRAKAFNKQPQNAALPAAPAELVNGEAVTTAAAEPGHWLLLADRGGVAAQIATELDAQGHTTTQVTPADFRGSFTPLLTDGGQPLRGVVYAWALDLDHDPQMPSDELTRSLPLTGHHPLLLARELCAAAPGTPPPLWLLSRGALAVLPSDIPDPVQAPLHGVGRVLQSEIREMTVRCVDAPWSHEEIARLVREFGHREKEDQIAYRGACRFVPRYRYAEPSCQRPAPFAPLSNHPARLTSRQFGVLDHLHLEAIDEPAPADGQVEIEVRATGLNFRDVMKALRIYPSDAPDVRLLGDEFSGVIRRIGAGVTRFQPGDRVTGVWAGAFTSRLVLDQQLVCPLPDRLSFEEGCTLFTASLTAHYALFDIARIQPGERVLIHSAAGGVGMAAVQMAMAAGAEVFATAGSSSKRSLLSALGVPHCYDSRSLEFAEEIMRDTGGEGIDIVLNSLAGEAIPKSFSCLRFGGRFIEIGKRDIYSNSKLGLRPFKNCLQFNSVDLARMISPEGLPPTIERVTRLLHDGTFRPLPYRTFSFARPASAFHFMAQGRHVGKIILSLHNERTTAVAPVIDTPPEFPADGTFLVTGGVRGFGLATARWLADHGARHLVLVSRTGKGDEETKAALAAFKEQGVTVRLEAVDITDPSATSALLRSIRKSGPPLTGVFHAAVVYADEMALKMTPEKYDQCVLPKTLGAWNLHQDTTGHNDPVRWFVLYSSISTVIANPGQSNYVAANLFLDSLALARRRNGLPATVINWDRIRETGQVARTKDLAAHLDRLGCPGLTNAEAFEAFGLALVNDATRLALSNVQFSVWARTAGPSAQLGRFAHLMDGAGDDGGDEQSQRIRQEILNAAPEDRLAIVENFLVEQVARVLRVPPKRISRTVPLNQQGLDSLMGVELLSSIEGKLGVSVPTTNMMDAPTIPRLSAFLVELVTGEKTVMPSAHGATPAATPAIPVVPATVPDDYPPLPAFAEDTTAAADRDALLAWTSRLPWKSGAPAVPPRAVLLTGATGFLGAHLAAELLEQGPPRLLCLVRAADDNAALQRVMENFERFDLGGRIRQHATRIRALAGDASLPGLGLPAAAFREAAACDAIVHLAATVNHVSSYRQLRDDNVLAVCNILHLAATGAPKTLHFPSSFAIFNSGDGAENQTCRESTPHDPLESLINGYGQTKAVCEDLIEAAAGQGLRASAFRLAPLTGDAVHGLTGSPNIVWRIVHACLEHGLAPRNDQNIHLTPVDFVAPVMARAILAGDTTGTYHLTSGEPVCIDDFFDVAESLGYRFRRLNYGPWIKALRVINKIHALTPYFVFGREHIDKLLQVRSLPRLDRSRAETYLAVGPAPDAHARRRLEFYFQRMIEAGFLPPPKGKSRTQKQPALTSN